MKLLKLPLNESSNTWCTVRPNKLKHWNWEQRNVYCRTMQGDGWFMPPKILNSLKDFSKAFLKAGGGGQCYRVCDQLMNNSLIGWWWRNRMVSQGLTLPVLRLQDDWELCAIRWRVFTSVRQPGNVHYILLSRCFGEEIKQRIMGKGPTRGKPGRVLLGYKTIY